MSKALIYGVITSVAVIGASATYFYPIVENINTFINGESNVDKDSIEKKSTMTDMNNHKESDIENQNMDSNADNPRIVLDEDSLKKLSNSKTEDNPTKTKLLEGEIPVTKNY